jgi:predicted RNase H-like HicB family nuclease
MFANSSALLELPVMNTKYEIVVYWNEADGCFLAEVPELPKLITDGATRVEALRNAETMIEEYLHTANEAGWSVPVPCGRLAFA